MTYRIHDTEVARITIELPEPQGARHASYRHIHITLEEYELLIQELYEEQNNETRSARPQ